MSTGNVVHTDVFELSATAEQVRQFLRDPARIADYYPGATGYGDFDAGHSYWIVSELGSALFEILEARCTDTLVAMHITTSFAKEQPTSPAAITAEPFITMVEEWDVQPKGNGCEVTKSWMDVELHQMKELPMADMIRKSASEEQAVIIQAWNAAAEKA